MKFKQLRKSPIVSYTLVALAISLIVNFSYMLLMVVNQSAEIRGTKSPNDQGPAVVAEGVISLSVDGFGYVIDDKGDSVYVDRRSVRRLELVNGDKLKIEARDQARYEGAHLIMSRLLERNGKEFDYGSLYNSSNQWEVILYQILFYMLVSLLLLMVMTFRRTGSKIMHLPLTARIAIALIFASIAYLLSPVTYHYTDEIRLVCQTNNMLDFVVMLKCLFMLAVVVLYSQIYVLVYQRQQMLIENEQLQNENLTTRYNMLVSQINPHFFFNSLNSLPMLVREEDTKRALEYIDQLSYTFRYLIQHAQSGSTTLREELEFASAYIYLFKIRYEDKLFFDIDIDEKYMEWTLPALSLQPLIGNAVKHNTITSKNPLHVIIRVVDGVLEVENMKSQKLDIEPSTGIGLQNLSSRWQIVAGRDIEVVDEPERFLVRLPLEK